MNNSTLNYLAETIESRFAGDNYTVRGDILSFNTDRSKVFNVIDYLYNNEGFRHLSMMSYSDWPEKNIIKLYYVVYSYTSQNTVIVSTELNREKPEIVTMKDIFEQAETYEVEFNEMMGIVFDGNSRMGEEFILEGWQGPPPMRRDFDTARYADEQFMFRPGREDGVDVREHIREITGERGGMDE
ncbi:MAG: NADH-quinone oxidoreductase subunit C [bacterium]